MIRNFTPRLYQETILATAVEKNTLVVLPTGTGKTNIFLMLAAHRLKNYPESKILFLGPTRPLIDQYRNVFCEYFDIPEEQMAVFTGFVRPEKRQELWQNARIIFSTPQAIENDIISNKIKLEDVSLLGIDEAHRATGDYAYSFIAKQYNKLAKYPRILALTASPGADVEKINEVCKNLYIEAVEIRAYDDPDVKEYVQKIEMEWNEVQLPAQFKEIKYYLDSCFRSKLAEMKHLGYLNSTQIAKKDLLLLQGQLQARIAHGEKEPNIWKAVSLAAEALKIYHASELLETQSPESLLNYLEKLKEEAANTKVKAVQNLVQDVAFRSALLRARKLVELGIEHPKLIELKNVINKNKGLKILVFNNFRDNASKLVSEINKLGVKAELFVGQQKRNGSGMSQKEQKEIIDKFRQNEFDALVCTSIGEEGLDIPKVDLVIFYEPIPSAIRHIQRRGRTGRSEKGRVIVLVTKGTRDEFYRWSAYHKEKRMHRILKDLKKKLQLTARKDTSLEKYAASGIKICADHREKGTGIIKELVDFGVNVDLKTLDTADYILSPRVGVEYKTQRDFVDSIIDGRLLSQLKTLVQCFERPVVVVEGDEDIFSQRNVHANAIRGMIATIAVSYGIPLIFTKNARETAALLAVIAKREQEDVQKDIQLHTKKPLTLKEVQEYVISSLPSVGTSLARDLLKSFGSVRNVVNASENHLKKVDGVGDKIAKNIKDAVDSEYKN